MLPVRARLFIVLYLLSGAAALLYEVAWLRLLTMSMGHTTAAVGAVLAAFMGGLALGAGVAGRATPALAPQRALRIYAVLEAAIALCALVMPFALGAMRPLLAWAYADGSGRLLFDAVRFVVSSVLIGVPAAAMGASFPIGVVAVRDSELGVRDSGFAIRRTRPARMPARYTPPTRSVRRLARRSRGLSCCRRLAYSAPPWWEWD